MGLRVYGMNKGMFRFSKNTTITIKADSVSTKPVNCFVQILERDRDKVFTKSTVPSSAVVLLPDQTDIPEQYRIVVREDCIEIRAGDDLGFIYGILYLSEQYLGIRPFWFYMDQKIERKEYLEIPETDYVSNPFSVRFRGWFINDEVLMMQWKYNENDVDGWKIALETLLRCGGNTVIPGTDEMSRRNRRLAADMGLWITHHHAEPLGAEMFVRKYPGAEPDYLQHEELFLRLWEEAIVGQKDDHVVWNLCFRGQGDMPFWADDKTGRFDSQETRGRLIGDVIRKQYELVKKHVENPVFCTNLYGEIMELYEQGYLELPPDIIKVRADNGFGKMVTRRQNNHNPRIPSMPAAGEKSPQGIYYHVSFYDLQAGNHITMLPNSVEFVDRELEQVLKNGGDGFWVVNCSNIRPHVYYLDVIRKKWMGRSIDDDEQSKEFAEEYFAGNEKVAECYTAYPKAMIPYGTHEDEHMGEQYYTENIRVLVNQFFVDKDRRAESLRWIAENDCLKDQIETICAPCRRGLVGLQNLLAQCQKVSLLIEGDLRRLFDATICLQAKIHAYCAEGVALFGQAYEYYAKGEYEKAFLTFGDSAVCFDRADEAMKQAEYGVWEAFYKNDCLADVRYTGDMIRKIMGVMRELGDSVYHDKWQRKYGSTKENKDVVLLMFTERHMTDWEIYLAMKRQ